MFRIILVILTISVLSGCASYEPPRLTKAELAAIDKLVVVSFIEDKISYAYTGFTVFNNEQFYEPIEGWDIGYKLSQGMKIELQKFTDVPIEVVRPEKWDKDVYKSDTSYLYFLRDKEDLIKQIASDMDARFIVIISAFPLNVDHSIPSRVDGLGIFNVWAWSDLVYHAHLDATLYDVQQGKALAGRFLGKHPRNPPFSYSWRGSFNDFNERQQKAVKDFIEEVALSGMTRLAISVIVPSDK